MDRLLELYKKTGGGHKRLSDDDFLEYGGLRKVEYQERKVQLQELGCENILPMKDESGDIVGWTWTVLE